MRNLRKKIVSTEHMHKKCNTGNRFVVVTATTINILVIGSRSVALCNRVFWRWCNALRGSVAKMGFLCCFHNELSKKLNLVHRPPQCSVTRCAKRNARELLYANRIIYARIDEWNFTIYTHCKQCYDRCSRRFWLRLCTQMSASTKTSSSTSFNLNWPQVRFNQILQLPISSIRLFCNKFRGRMPLIWV